MYIRIGIFRSRSRAAYDWPWCHGSNSVARRTVYVHWIRRHGAPKECPSHVDNLFLRLVRGLPLAQSLCSLCTSTPRVCELYIVLGRYRYRYRYGTTSRYPCPAPPARIIGHQGALPTRPRHGGIIYAYSQSKPSKVALHRALELINVICPPSANRRCQQNSLDRRSTGPLREIGISESHPLHLLNNYPQSLRPCIPPIMLRSLPLHSHPCSSHRPLPP